MNKILWRTGSHHHHFFFFLASLNCISLSTSLLNGFIKPFQKIFYIRGHTLKSGSFRSPSIGILVAKESLCLFFSANPKKVTAPSHTRLDTDLLGLPRLSLIRMLWNIGLKYPFRYPLLIANSLYNLNCPFSNQIRLKPSKQYSMPWHVSSVGNIHVHIRKAGYVNRLLDGVSDLVQPATSVPAGDIFGS